MTDLKKGKSYVTVVGRAKIGDKTFKLDEVSKSGFTYSRVNIGIQTDETNIVYGEIMGGYYPSNPVIYTSSKEDGSSMEVSWADRFNENIIKSVANYRLYRVGLEKDENGSIIVKSFLSAYDMAQYLKETLQDGMEITARGSFSYHEYNNEIQRTFQIQSIFIPYQEKEKDENGNETGNLLPVKYRANFVQTILLTDESFKGITKQDADAGEVIISAQVPEYVGKKDGKEIKKTLPFPIAITVPINKKNPEITEKILNAFFKIKKNKVRELTIEGNIVDGYEKQEVSEKDIELSSDIKELIAMGLYSKEEVINKMTVRGNRVSKLVFTRPSIIKEDKNGTAMPRPEMDDEKYTPDDLIIPIPEDDEEEKKQDGENPFEGYQDEGTDDSSWMTALGIWCYYLRVLGVPFKNSHQTKLLKEVKAICHYSKSRAKL